MLSPAGRVHVRNMLEQGPVNLVLGYSYMKKTGKTAQFEVKPALSTGRGTTITVRSIRQSSHDT